MFIPAEGVYYDLLVNKIGTTKASTRDLIEYAVHEKNVHIVSPTTFYVTLQSLWQGMRAYHIQEKTKEIVKNISVLSKHLKVYEEHMNRLGSQMDTTVKTYNRASQELKKIDKDITRITGESPEIETKKIDS
jgi:DNA recombination protein RmuC